MAVVLEAAATAMWHLGLDISTHHTFEVSLQLVCASRTSEVRYMAWQK
jgi:hypothetical protein